MTHIPPMLRPCAVAAFCLFGLWAPAQAQYDEIQGAGPMVAIPRITVRPADMTPEERAQYLARQGQGQGQGQVQPQHPSPAGTRPRDAAHEGERQLPASRPPVRDSRSTAPAER